MRNLDMGLRVMEMDGFRVDTTALIQAGSQYASISARLSDDGERLRELASLLEGQTIGGDVSDLLRGAIRTVETASEDSRELSKQCAGVSEAYERVERQVAAVVAALPSTSPFAEAAASGQTNLYGAYRPTKPVLFGGNRLPCESWLLDRAIKASLEGES